MPLSRATHHVLESYAQLPLRKVRWQLLDHTALSPVCAQHSSFARGVCRGQPQAPGDGVTYKCGRRERHWGAIRGCPRRGHGGQEDRVGRWARPGCLCPAYFPPSRAPGEGKVRWRGAVVDCRYPGRCKTRSPTHQPLPPPYSHSRSHHPVDWSGDGVSMQLSSRRNPRAALVCPRSLAAAVIVQRPVLPASVALPFEAARGAGRRSRC